MEQISFSAPDTLVKKLRKYAKSTDISVSSSIVKLLDLAFLCESKIQENKAKKSNCDPDLDTKMKGLIIQNAVILKHILNDGFNFDKNKMDSIRGEIHDAKKNLLDNS